MRVAHSKMRNAGKESVAGTVHRRRHDSHESRWGLGVRHGSLAAETEVENEHTWTRAILHRYLCTRVFDTISVTTF